MATSEESNESDTDVAEHRIEGTDDLVMMTIKDQASDIEHGWREAIQNGIDAPGTNMVTLAFDEHVTVVENDGEVLDLTEEKGQELLTNLGASSKDADDDSTIGQFGVGKGQVIAKARTAMVSGDQALLFDIEDWGLTVRQTSLVDAPDVLEQYDTDWATHVREALDGREYVDGFLIVSHHYEDETPDYSWKWDDYEDRVRDRFKFTSLATGVDIKINGELISKTSPQDVIADSSKSHVETFRTEDDGTVHIAVEQGSVGSLSVYSNGIYVKDVENRGLAGAIITEENLDLNFARNEIKSGCELWSRIQDRLDEIRFDLFERIQDDRLNQEAREFLVQQMVDDESRRPIISAMDILATATEDYTSLDEVQRRDKIVTARTGDQAADKLNEAWGMLSLSESDEATNIALEKWHTFDDMPERVDAEEFAEDRGMHTTEETVDPEVEEEELRSVQQQKLAIARRLADEMDIDREIRWGESDLANAWTDGYEMITLTDSAAPANSWAGWVPELFRILCHEAAHTSKTLESCSHGRRFEQSFRELVEDEWQVLSEVMVEINEKGISTVVDESLEQ